MGVGKHSAIHLAKIAHKVEYKGCISTLGVQDTRVDKSYLNKLQARYSLAGGPAGWEGTVNDREPFKSSGFITGESYWRYLGFDTINSLDVSDYENSSHFVDLNKREVPEALLESSDCVYDGGTIEHVFHLPNALSVLHKVTKVGGIIIHQTPSLPLIDHGFYMFSPTFFYDYYRANNYEIVDIGLVMYGKDSDKEPCWFYDYSPGDLGHVSNIGYCFPGMNMLVVGCFRKTPDSTCDVVPSQGAYVKHWSERSVKS